MLVSVGVELIFFTVASWYGLCFGFVLNTYGDVFVIAAEGLHKAKALLFLLFLLLVHL